MSFGRSLLALSLAAVIWVPSIHAFYRADREELLHGLETQALHHWSVDQAPITELRRSNAEWDFMARTYTVLALANRALAHPEERTADLEAIDRILDQTLALEAEKGPYFFLMGYAKDRPFVAQPTRSLFIDGEIALMLGARRVVEEDPRYAALHRVRAAAIVERMSKSPTLSAESYPDEAWTFCNAVALASLKIYDVLEGSDHSRLMAAWVDVARHTLIDVHTGLLVSSYHLDGTRKDGPEGSSIFMAAHCLELVDPELAKEQWDLAKHALGYSFMGFGYAREWANAGDDAVDIDSGPTVPILEANAGASGLMILGAAAFHDQDRLDALLRSLELAAFPKTDASGRHYRASNALGDAVLFYALAQGPLWAEVEARSRKDAS